MPRYLLLLAAVAVAAPVARAQTDANDATEKALKAASLKAAPFIVTVDHRPRTEPESASLKRTLLVPCQADLFA